MTLLVEVMRVSSISLVPLFNGGWRKTEGIRPVVGWTDASARWSGGIVVGGAIRSLFHPAKKWTRTFHCGLQKPWLCERRRPPAKKWTRTFDWERDTWLCEGHGLLRRNEQGAVDWWWRKPLASFTWRREERRPVGGLRWEASPAGRNCSRRSIAPGERRGLVGGKSHLTVRVLWSWSIDRRSRSRPENIYKYYI